MYEDADVEAVIAGVAMYLRENPRACDTAEGIRRWWLPPELDCTQETVIVALDWMTRHELIEMTTAADGRQRFARRGGGEQLDAWLRGASGGQTIQ